MKWISVSDFSARPRSGRENVTTINTKSIAKQKIMRGINFVRITKIFSSVDTESGHSCLVFVQYPHDSPRSAWELQKKIGAATNSRKNYPKKIQKKGGELICNNFGVDGVLGGPKKSFNSKESSEAFPRIFRRIRTFYSQNKGFW